jgi:hypothetical protein
MMKRAQWHDVLEPRAAVIAGLVGLAVVWPLTYYVSHTGLYASWGFSQPAWRAIGTTTAMLGFALPYWLAKWLVKW